jgi:DtxR family Mn-dependent transcriptional regulator
MYSFTEENYLKAIYKIGRKMEKGVNTNSISHELDTKAASVTDMIKRLDEKGLVSYKKYQGVTLTNTGKKVAIEVLRKHRLWELFLVEKLGFGWDEVHDIAEELEHINSTKLINKLDQFLGFPKYDPHGDPIPDKNGTITSRHENLVNELKINEKGIIVGVKDSSTSFLQYLDECGLILGKTVELIALIDYDESMNLRLEGNKIRTISNKVAQNLYIKKVNEIS